MDDETTRVQAAAADELTRLLLDDLGPVVGRYRVEVGRVLGLTGRELDCLDLLRRLGPVPSVVVGERLGLRRSGVSTSLRRLEEAGHVARRASRDHEQGLEIALVPHAERDEAWRRMRAPVHTGMTKAAHRFGLHRWDRQGIAAGLLVLACECLPRETLRSVEADDLERLRALRREDRRTAGPDPWHRR